MLYNEILRLTKDTTDNYIITDTSDEKLNVIARLLLDERGRGDARKAAEKQIRVKIEGPIFHLYELPKDIIAIQRYKEGDTTLDESNPLEIEISRLNLRKLISIWDRLMLMRPYHIILKRRHDSDDVEMTFEDEPS